MSEQEWGWWAGPNEEIYTYGGPFATREDAISEGRGSADGEGFHIIEARQHSVRFSAERLIEEQYFEDDDLFDHDHVEPDRMGPKETVAAADAELQALLDGWLERHAATFMRPNVFLASRNAEWIEPETDAEAA